MILTDRDREVIQAVNDFRAMRHDQIESLLFPSKVTAQRRLRKLWEHGFLQRDWLPTVGGIQTSPTIYKLDRQGAELLKAEHGYHPDDIRLSTVSDTGYLFLSHLLGLSEVRLAIVQSCKEHDFELVRWDDEKTLKADYDRVRVGRESVAVLPDAYVIIQVPKGKLHFFLEYDRGTERLKVFRRKIAAYLAYLRSPKCEVRYGTTKIRVLSVTEGGKTGAGVERQMHLKEKAEQLRAGRNFWFGRVKDVTAQDILTAPIWQVAPSSNPTPLVSS